MGCEVLTCEWVCDHHPDQVGKHDVVPVNITSIGGVSIIYDQKLYEEMTAIQLDRDSGARIVYEEDYDTLLAIDNIYQHTFMDTDNGDVEMRGGNLSSCLMSCRNLKTVAAWYPINTISIPLSAVHLACVGGCYKRFQP